MKHMFVYLFRQEQERAVIHPMKGSRPFHFGASRRLYYNPPVENQLLEGLDAHASGCHRSPGFPCFIFHGFSVRFSFSTISSSASFFAPSPRTPTVPSTSPSPTPSSRLSRRGLSSTEGFAAHRSSAACARCLSSRCLVMSSCCSNMVGGVGLV